MRVGAGVGVEQFCRIKQHCFWNRRTNFEILHTKCLLLPSQVCLAYNDSCRPATSTSILQKKMCLWDQWIQTFLTSKCLICWGSRDAPLEWWCWQWDSSISTFFRVGRRWEHCSWWPSCKWESASLSDGHLHCFSMSIEKSLLVAWKDVQIGFRYLTDINCVCETEDSQMNFVCKETRLGAHLWVQIMVVGARTKDTNRFFQTEDTNQNSQECSPGMLYMQMNIPMSFKSLLQQQHQPERRILVYYQKLLQSEKPLLPPVSRSRGIRPHSIQIRPMNLCSLLVHLMFLTSKGANQKHRIIRMIPIYLRRRRVSVIANP